MLLAIANQPSDGLSTYTTGSDVSRYQRSTVPGSKSKASPEDKMADAMNSLALAAAGKAPAAATTTVVSSTPTGPIVRVSRGNSVTIVPVGAK
jgi:pilus assembly protein CpaB